MAKVVYTPLYEERARKFLKKHPNLTNQYRKTLMLLEINPFHPSLRLHKCSNFYSVSINMQYRTSLDFFIYEDMIIPIDVGGRDYIYR